MSSKKPPGGKTEDPCTVHAYGLWGRRTVTVCPARSCGLPRIESRGIRRMPLIVLLEKEFSMLSEPIDVKMIAT